MHKFVISLVVIAFLVPAFASARSIAPLTVSLKSTAEVSQICNNPATLRPGSNDQLRDAYGCFTRNPSIGLYHIDMSYEVAEGMAFQFAYNFAHELGHYFLWDRDLSMYNGDEERAADRFSLWLFFGRINPTTFTPAEHELFLNSIRN